MKSGSIVDSFQFFHDLGNAWADDSILLREIHDAQHVFTVGMWIFPTGLWTMFVNLAGIIFQGKEGARCGRINPIAI
jgi:hypothetical protein